MNRNDGARGDARKARESARLEAGAGDVEALAEALWIADRDASASGTGFGATFAEDSCNYAYRSQARYTLASDWLARVIADAKAEAVEAFARAAYNEWPIGSCAHKCFREDRHIAPKDCLHGPDWLIARIEAAR